MKGHTAFLAIISIAVILAADSGGMQSIQAPGQQQEGPGYKFSVQSQLVEVYLTVTRGSQPVGNLQIADFELLEDGVPVPLDRLDSQEVPLQIALLVDTSESVQEALYTIQDAAISFVESLNPEDRMMLTLFNSEIRMIPQTSAEREPILKAIRGARARGVTRLYDALLQGMKYLDGKPGRKAIVCFTDGEDTAGTSSRFAVLDAAARSGYPIYAIGAGAGLGMSSLQMILREFAEINSGKAFFIQNLKKLREAFRAVASEMRSAYVLNYYTRIPPDGSWHDIRIKIKDPSLTVHARKGFYARNAAGVSAP